MYPRQTKFTQLSDQSTSSEKLQARDQVISKAYVQVQQHVVALVRNFTAIHKNPRIAPSLD